MTHFSFRFRALFLSTLGALGALGLCLGMASAPGGLAERAARLTREALLVDGHNDLAWRLREEGDLALEKYDIAKKQPRFNTDIPRLRQGGVGAQFWSAYVPASLMHQGTAVQVTLEQMDLIHRMVAKYPETFEMASTAADVVRLHAAGKIASMIGIEGGHSIDNSLDTLRDLYAKGARYMTLTHSDNLDWADACTDKEVLGGLSEFGEQVVREMNRLGMLVDISHVSAKTMRHALRVTKAPVIASHSSAYGVKAHVRNVPDDVLKLVAANGGVVMVNFYPEFIVPENRGDARAYFTTEPPFALSLPVEDEFMLDAAKWAREHRYPKGDVHVLVDHIDHIVRVAGIDHVGIGSDFDGVPYLPEGLEDVSKYPAVTEELLRRGYTDNDVRKILGENLVRAWGRAEAVARELGRP